MTDQPNREPRLPALQEAVIELARDALSNPRLQSLQLTFSPSSTLSPMVPRLTVETWHQDRVGGADDE